MHPVEKNFSLTLQGALEYVLHLRVAPTRGKRAAFIASDTLVSLL